MFHRTYVSLRPPTLIARSTLKSFFFLILNPKSEKPPFLRGSNFGQVDVTERVESGLGRR